MTAYGLVLIEDMDIPKPSIEVHEKNTIKRRQTVLRCLFILLVMVKDITRILVVLNSKVDKCEMVSK